MERAIKSMGFLILFKTTFLAMLEIFLLGGCGYFLIKKSVIDEAGLKTLSKLVVELFLPLFIFSQFMQRFSFSLYSNWLIFPFLSLVITAVGLGLGMVYLKIFNVASGQKEKREFLSLVMFQNSGYLPLILAATLLPTGEAQALYIYIFLFLLGFNLTIWSFGCWFLRQESIKNLEWASFFSPPVIATLVSLFLVLLRIDRLIPMPIINASDMLGKCVLPLAMIVVGGGLALIPFSEKIDKKTIGAVTILKLFVLPIAALLFLLIFKVPFYIGILVMLEASVPSATSLSLITRHYNLDDRLINQGVLYTHIVSLFTLPLFLSLYQMFAF